MKVKRSIVIALLTPLGYENAKTWTGIKMLAKLTKIAKEATDDDQDKIEDKEAVKLMKQMRDDPGMLDDLEIIESAAAEDKGSKKKDKKADKKSKKKAEAEEDGEDEEEEEEDEEGEDEGEDEEEEEKPKKKDKAKKADKKGKPKKAAKEATTDAFGSREGSQAASINAQLTAKPQTAEVIAKGAKQKVYRVKGHLASLIAKKLVVKSDDGYALKGDKKKKK
jgi:hypothetical protein